MKLIREQLYEKFVEDSDPIHDMNIGVIKFINDWYNEFVKECGDYWIKGFHINEDCTIDCFDCNIAWYRYNTLPEYIKFNKIKRTFYCCFDNIKTIELNGPKYVGDKYEIFPEVDVDVDFTIKDVRNVCECKDIKINPAK